MAEPWTDRDEQEYQALLDKGFAGRDVDEEMRFKHLEARRNLAMLKKSEAVRKRGPLYKISIVVFLLGVGSCIGGVAGGGGGLMGLGVGLLILSSVFNWANSKATGVD
jgi:hypothetical protein